MKLGYRTLFKIMSGVTLAALIFLSSTIILKVKPVTKYSDPSLGFQTMGFETLEKLQRVVIDPANIIIAVAVLAFSIYCMYYIKRYETV